MKRLFVILAFGLLVNVRSAPVQAQDITAESLQAAADYSTQNAGEGMVVMQNGTIIFEEEQNGYDLRVPHMLASGTKSFVCALAVAAIDDELLDGFDMPVVETITEFLNDPLRSQITVRNLLRLDAGIQSPESLRPTPNIANIDTYEISVTTPAIAAPGERFIYGPVQYNIFGELLTRLLEPSGETLLGYVQRRIFDLLDISIGRWTTDGAGNPQLAGGAFMTAEDWLRYGQFILQNGIWEGEQILSPDLLTECFENSPANPAYGLTFWLHDQGGINGAAPRPSFVLSDQTPDVYGAAGAGMQRLYIIPSLQLVVVRFSALRGGGSFRDAEFIDLLLGQ